MGFDSICMAPSMLTRTQETVLAPRRLSPTSPERACPRRSARVLPKQRSHLHWVVEWDQVPQVCLADGMSILPLRRHKIKPPQSELRGLDMHVRARPQLHSLTAFVRRLYAERRRARPAGSPAASVKSSCLSTFNGQEDC